MTVMHSNLCVNPTCESDRVAGSDYCAQHERWRVMIRHAETGELLDDFNHVPSVAELYERRDTPVKIEFRNPSNSPSAPLPPDRAIDPGRPAW